MVYTIGSLLWFNAGRSICITGTDGGLVAGVRAETDSDGYVACDEDA